MKVAINAWFYGKINTGSGQYLHNLLPKLIQLKTDLKVVLILPQPQYDEYKLELGQLPDQISVEAVPVMQGGLGKVWFEQVTFPLTAQAIGADLAHVPYFGSPLFPSGLTVVTIHDLIPVVLPAYRGNLLVRTYTSLVSLAAKRAHAVLTDSDASRTDILQRLKLPPQRVQTVYLAHAPQYRQLQRDSLSPQLADDETEIRRKYNLPDKFVLYMGGFDVRKNVRALIQAWTQVVPQLTEPASLVLAGRLPRQNSAFFPHPHQVIESLPPADREAIQPHVLTPGWIEEADKPALYRAAEVFVYPSIYEGFGLPVLEAMACGTPVITSQVSSLPELAGSAAILIDPHDPATLSTALLGLLHDPERRRQVVAAGLDQVQRFSWLDTGTQTLAAYKGLLA